MIGYETARRTANRDPRTPSWYRQQRRGERHDGGDESNELVFERIFSRESLYRAFQRLKDENGPAPGRDGITYSDVSNHEAGQIAGALSKAILNGTYKPHPTRNVRIPKQGKNEYRTLKLATISDRIVSKALYEALQPYWEKVFLHGSWGYRRARGALGMLADMEARMIKNDCWVLAADDIRNAFDNVPIDKTIEAHRVLFMEDRFASLLPCDMDKMLEIIETILKGSDQTKQVGIDQGNCYSPTALNVLLQYAHDCPLERSGNTLWCRYADNLLYPVKSVSEGHQVLRKSRELLNSVHMTLKGEEPPVDLAHGSIAVLGIEFRKQGNRLQYRPPNSLWDELDENLVNAYDTPDPHMTASSSLRGWVDTYGMVFETAEELLRKILHYAA